MFIEHFQSTKLDFHRSKPFLYHTLVFPTHVVFNLKCKYNGKYIWHRFEICIWPLKLNDVTGRHWTVWVNNTQTTDGGPRTRVKVFGRGSGRPLPVTPVTCMEGEGGRVHGIKLYMFIRVRCTMTGIPLLWCFRPLRVPPGKFGENHQACSPHSALFPLRSKMVHKKHKFSSAPPFLGEAPPWSTLLGPGWDSLPISGFSEQVILDLNLCLPTWLLSVMKATFWLSSLLFVLFSSCSEPEWGRKRGVIWRDPLGDSSTVGRCGPVSIFELLTLCESFASCHGMWFISNF